MAVNAVCLEPKGVQEKSKHKKNKASKIKRRSLLYDLGLDAKPTGSTKDTKYLFIKPVRSAKEQSIFEHDVPEGCQPFLVKIYVKNKIIGVLLVFIFYFIFFPYRLKRVYLNLISW